MEKNALLRKLFSLGMVALKNVSNNIRNKYLSIRERLRSKLRGKGLSLLVERERRF
jgi:hypothetical protein